MNRVVCVEGKKILVVDDNPDTCFLICDLLRDHHYQCVSAETPVEGLRMARQEKPDLILLDMILPGMSGFGFIREISRHKRLKKIPIIVLTVVNDDEVAAQMVDLGAAAYLRKVCRDQELLSTVAAHIA